MGNKNKLLLSLFLGCLAIFALFFFISLEIDEAKAGSDDNVYGYAWSENIGWISFNNTSGGGSVNYGVDIDETTGLFSGYAWSENIGWISFNQSELSGCPSSPCQAKVDLSSYEVSGWVRALAHGGDWDGWIKLRGPNYGVKINDVTQEFEGWAWGNDVVGWISFNCSNPESGDTCSITNYSVKTTILFNNSPTVTTNNPQPLDYCHYSLPTRFSWNFNDVDPDDFQDYYRIQIDNNSDFSSPEVDSGKVDSYSEAFNPIYSFPYNDTYYWRVMVWDNNGADSGWNNGSPLNTPLHALPRPDFALFPSSPSVDKIIQLCATQESGICPEDVSTCYDINNNSISCSGKNFLWTFPTGTEFATGTSATSENPRVKFDSTGQKVVSLQITDDVGTCSKTKQVGVTSLLPEWQEVAP
jgi:hypothetical protein